MSLSRRFLNLIVDNRAIPGAKSLCCLDLTQRRHSLFDDDTAPPPPARNKQTTTTTRARRAPKRTSAVGAFTKLQQLPIPSLSVRASDSDLKDDDQQRTIHFFPTAADRRVFCVDQAGRGFLLEADTPRMVMLPRLLHRDTPRSGGSDGLISLYVPGDEPDFDDLDGGGGGDLFIMDRTVTVAAAAANNPDPAAAGVRFEAFVYRQAGIGGGSLSKTWHRVLLPPPPPHVVHAAADGHSHGCLEITAHAVVGGGGSGSGPEICVSVGGHGTYRLRAARDPDTSCRFSSEDAAYCRADAWREVGGWALPFRGEARYVPELKLWFGFNNGVDGGEEEGRQTLNDLAAADLSAAVDSSSSSLQPSVAAAAEAPPQVQGSWKEVETPEGWRQVKDPQLVCLGSRRFCVARFFRTGGDGADVEDGGGDGGCENVTVLTGVEIFRGVNMYAGRAELKMVKHKSLCHKARCGEDTITAVF